jgi:Flp pilus assembly protein TadG
MLNLLKGRLQNQRGQALIEFALLFPFLMMFLFVLLDFGIAIDRRVVIQHAVREGVRQGAVGLPADLAGDDNDIKDLVVKQSQDTLSRDDITICFVDGPDANTNPGNVGDSIRVSATYVYAFDAVSGQLLLPLVGVNPGDLDITMTPNAEATLESSVLGANAC